MDGLQISITTEVIDRQYYKRHFEIKTGGWEGLLNEALHRFELLRSTLQKLNQDWPQSPTPWATVIEAGGAFNRTPGIELTSSTKHFVEAHFNLYQGILLQCILEAAGSPRPMALTLAA